MLFPPFRFLLVTARTGGFCFAADSYHTNEKAPGPKWLLNCSFWINLESLSNSLIANSHPSSLHEMQRRHLRRTL